MLVLALLLRIVVSALGRAYSEVSPRDFLILMSGVLCVGATYQVYAEARVVPRGMRVIGLALVVQTVSVIALATTLAPLWGIGGIASAWLIGSSLSLAVSLGGWWVVTRRGRKE